MSGDEGVMPEPGVVAVIGLGLIGGSLARDLAALGWTVRAHDRDPAALADAAREGIVASNGKDDATRPGEGALEGVVAGADLVVVATPVAAAAAVIRAVAPLVGPDTAVTDVCSTKRTVVEAAEAAGIGERFVGSHPMAGHHRSGWTASRAGLFRDAAVWLSPTVRTARDVLSGIEALWRSVGARPARIEPDRHDRIVAWSSHLPQLTASALASALAQGGIAPAQLGPGGRDTTRLAASDPELWAGILADNADEVGPALVTLINELIRLRRALFEGDDASVRAVLETGSQWAS